MSSELAGHRRHVGFRRRQRDARRNGDERHHHGEDAKGHEPTVQRSLHPVTVPQREGGDKNGTASLLIIDLRQGAVPPTIGETKVVPSVGDE